MNIIEVQGVSKQYSSHKALDNVSLEIPAGSVYGLLGPNGAGKTTLIRIINHITAPDSGQVLFDGHPLVAEDVVNIGYLPEERGLYKKMKVGDQALFFAKLKGLKTREAETQLRAWFEKFGISDWWNKKVEELSKGMAQKVQFIVTVLHRPKLLIFDEPTSALDPEGRAEVISIIERLKSMGSTIVLSTHILSDVERVANRIGIMTNGRLAEEGYLTDILRKHGGDVIHLSVRGLTDDLKIKLLTVDYARAEFNDLNGQFRFGTENAEETSRRLIQLLAENGAAVDTFSIGTASLEEVFRMVVGANAD